MLWSSTLSGRRNSGSASAVRRVAQAAAAGALGLAFVVVAPGAALADDTALVTLSSPATAVLPPVASAVARYPVQPTTPGAALDVVPLGIVANGIEVMDTGAITAAVYDPVNPAVVLTIATDKLPEVGQYDLTVQLTARDAGTAGVAPATQILTLALSRPTGALAVTQPVTWTRTPPLCLLGACLSDPSWLGTPDDQPPLVVTAGEDSRILDLRGSAPQGNAPRLALSVPTTSLPLASGRETTLGYSADASTPGSVSVQANLFSDQVTGPVPVAMTIVTRRPATLIGIVVVLGVLGGWLVRFSLPRASARVALLRRRRELATWLDEIDGLYPDPTVRSVTDAARRSLHGADEAQVVASETAVKAAVSELEKSLRDLTLVHDELANSVRARPDVEDFEPGFAEVRAACARALTQIGQCRAAAAAESLRTAKDDLRKLVSTPPPVDALRRLANVVSHRNAGAQGALSSTLTTLRAQVDGIVRRPLPEDASVADLSARLTELAAAVHGPDLRGALLDISDEARQVVAGVGQATTPVPADDVAVAAVGAAASGLERAVDGGPTEAAADSLEALQEAYRALAERVQADDAARAKVEKGDVIGGIVSTHLDAGTVVERQIDTPPDVGLLAGTPLPALAVPGLPARAVVAAASLSLGALHVVVAGTIALLTAYALFLPDWIGSNAQLGQVAVWAFAFDTSIAGLVLLASKTTPAPPAAT